MQKNIRNFICALIAVLFAICFFVGKHFDKGWKLQLDIWCILKLILTVAVVYFAVCCIYKGMDLLGRGRIRKNRINELVFEKNRGKNIWLILILLWLPNYILYFPGCLTYDAINQLEQFVSGQWTNHHPVLTTFIESAIVVPLKNIGRFEMGTAVYLMIILLFSSGVVAWGFQWMRKHEISYEVRWAGLIFFGFYPLWSAYARTLVKDTLFYPVFYLFILQVMDIVFYDGKFFDCKRKIFKFSLLCLLLCLIRHNGFYIVAATLAGLIWFCRNNRGKCVIIFFAVVIFWEGYNAALPALGVVPGGKQEMLSIPFQQTARYVKEHGGEVTEEERRAIDRVLDYKVIAENYDPNLSDPVKNTYKQKDEYLGDYFRVWWQQFLKHPKTYIKATLNGTYGYYAWKNKIKYPFGYNIQPEGHRLYATDYKLTFNSKLEKERALYEKAATAVFVRGPLKILTESMLYNWFFILLFGYMIQNKQIRRYWVIFLPFWVSFFICLASPVNGDLRYMMPVMSVWPLYLAFIVRQTAEAKQKLKEQGQGN